MLHIVHRNGGCQSRRPRRSRHSRRRQTATVRALTGARLLLGKLVRPVSQEDAAQLVASSCCYLNAAVAVLQAEDTQLMARILSGDISLLAAAAEARKRARLLTAWRAAAPKDRLFVLRTVNRDRDFSKVIVPAAE